MYIYHVTLENIRGFSNVSLDLTRPDGTLAGWTVFAGLNASGKTTLLQAIALAFYGENLGPEHHVDWQRKGETRCSIRLTIEPGGFDKDAPPKYQPAIFEYGWSHEGALTHDRRFKEFERYRPTAGWFLLGYGPFRRLSGESIDQKVTAGSARERVSTLFHEGAALVESVSWLQKINYQGLEGGPDSEKARDLEKKIIRLLNDGLLPPNVTILKVSSKGLHLRMDEQELVLQQLSDGYRGTISMILDLIRQLDTCYGGLELQDNGSHCFIDHDGVVMIDEVDAHLHISWQKKIGFWLKTRFPKIQFLVTTHSPFICQAADPRGLISLSGSESKQARHIDDKLFHTVVNGSVDDAVLTELFGLEYTHSDNAEALREELARIEGRLLQNKASAEDLQRFEALKNQMPRGSEVSRELRQLREVLK